MSIIKAASGLALLGSGAFSAAEFKASQGNTTDTPDVLLILGCRVRGEKPEETLQMRIDAAAEYLKKNPTVIAIACGGIVHEDQYKSEAQAISESLVEQGVEIERIILEDKSTTTQENFRNAIEILGKMSEEKMRVAILSSEHHLLRASLLAKKCGLEVTTIPAPSPKKLLLKNYLREFICFAEFLK